MNICAIFIFILYIYDHIVLCNNIFESTVWCAVFNIICGILMLIK